MPRCSCKPRLSPASARGWRRRRAARGRRCCRRRPARPRTPAGPEGHPRKRPIIAWRGTSSPPCNYAKLHRRADCGEVSGCHKTERPPQTRQRYGDSRVFCFSHRDADGPGPRAVALQLDLVQLSSELPRVEILEPTQHRYHHLLHLPPTLAGASTGEDTNISGFAAANRDVGPELLAGVGDIPRLGRVASVRPVRYLGRPSSRRPFEVPSHAAELLSTARPCHAGWCE